MKTVVWTMDPQSRLWSACVAEMPSPPCAPEWSSHSGQLQRISTGMASPTPPRSRGVPDPTKVKWYPYSVHLRQGQTMVLLMVPGWLAPGLWPQVMAASHPGQDPRISRPGLWSRSAMRPWNHVTHRTILDGLVAGPPGWLNHCQTPGPGQAPGCQSYSHRS